MECAIGVPAVWDVEAHQRTISAAEQAGIPNPDLVQEPEAAAALTMQYQQELPKLVVARPDGQTGSLTTNASQQKIVSKI